ncbi:hypothetical protein KC19_VG077400 [Ceratodon purpureus]|uniref:Fe2OG dioxygenase domain-containing protein n=1 Tax=Ceratodon purpureus TaxID=3225 RepID=A0A8T0HN17_CERPU|nr:hypothetical protein KC19_VG077400 [Ceratodon purpureus]
MGAAPDVESVEGGGEGKVKETLVREVEGEKGQIPLYTLQALWDGKMKLKDFEVVGEEKPTLPHNVYEQDEALPVIDIGALVGMDKAAREENMGRMLEAAKSWGFFKIRNHGVSLEVVKKVERNVKKFFALPMDKKLLVKATNFAFGYVGGSPVDWRYKWWLEGLHMKVKEENIRNMVNLVWSGDKAFAEEFISDLTSYFVTMRELSRLMVECLTEGLGLEPDTYTKLESKNAICNARVNHYPACPDPSKVFGIPAHTDPQMLSVLYQDEVGGLQVLKDGKWIGIQPDDSTFVVNLGDTFQAITNGILHSAAHRVAVNTTRSRYATIYFYGIDNVQQLRVPPELVTEDRPLKYRPFTVNEYRDYIVNRQIPTDGLKYLEIDQPVVTGTQL